MGRTTKRNSCIVYKHTCLPNGKVYIGITSTSLEKRAGVNGKNYKKNTLFFRAIQKYGWDAFSHEILYDNLTREEAAQKEIELIAEYDSTNPSKGYNISVGGEGGNRGVRLSDEARAELSKKYSGEGNPMYGKKGKLHPAYGRKHSEEALLKISAIHKGKVLSQEAREKLSLSKKNAGAWAGENNPMSGKTYGKAPQAKSVICLETGVIYDSVKRAAEDIGGKIDSNEHCIISACKGKYKTACGGLHWQYVDKLDLATNAESA